MKETDGALPDIPAPPGRTLRVQLDPVRVSEVAKALASEPRLRILNLLNDRVYNVTEIAEALGMPLSTANMHIKMLEDAGLVISEFQPAQRGRQKICARVYDTVLIELTRGIPPLRQVLEYSMPIGAYTDCDVTPTCGLASEQGIIGFLDEPATFFDPARLKAQLLWFRQGWVEYRFPNRLPEQYSLDSVQVSMEICSEAPMYHNDWLSDITLWINGVELGVWTSPADFGGQRGALSPDWWESWNSQFGLLKVWQVSGEGTFVDGVKISDVKLDELGITGRPWVSLRVGVEAGARHSGGLNLFGSRFGNYPQDIIMRFHYH